MNQPFPNYVHLSPEDSIVQLNLTNRSFNALTRAGMRTIGEVLRNQVGLLRCAVLEENLCWK